MLKRRHPLQEIFGKNVEEQVISGVQQTAAEVISKSIAASGSAMTIDVEEKVNATLR